MKGYEKSLEELEEPEDIFAFDQAETSWRNSDTLRTSPL